MFLRITSPFIAGSLISFFCYTLLSYLTFPEKKPKETLFHKQGGNRLLHAMVAESFVFYTFSLGPAETGKA